MHFQSIFPYIFYLNILIYIFLQLHKIHIIHVISIYFLFKYIDLYIFTIT
jgi:hypothetical protein